MIYEVNTAIWLADLSRAAGQRVTLADVPASAWDEVTPAGVDAVWLMGVWERSPAGLRAANANAALQASFRDALPDLRPDDVVGSPYCVRRYVVDASFGGPEALAWHAPCWPPAASGCCWTTCRTMSRRPPLGDEPAGTVRQRRRGRHRGRPGGLGTGRRAHPGPRPGPVLPAVARCRAARCVLARPARGGRGDPDGHRRAVRRNPMRHGHADDQRRVRQDLGGRTGAERRDSAAVIAGCAAVTRRPC